jgi:hypothetical protein
MGEVMLREDMMQLVFGIGIISFGNLVEDGQTGCWFF